jgi:proteasome accessory factor C
MLPYAIRHPGVSIEELTQKFGFSRRGLIADLELVFLCGLPGYGPGDLIDVSIEGDRVYVRMADYFAAPLRLTPAEALTLCAGAQAIADLPGMETAGALRRAVKKLDRALGTVENRAVPGISVALDSPIQHLKALGDALSRGRRVVLEYLSASRATLTTREVDPWGLVAALGRWYLVGWDHLRSDERMFRVDRIKSVTATDVPAGIPADFDPQVYGRAFAGRGDSRLTLEISAAAAEWFEDYYPVIGSAVLDDGWRRVELVASSDRWAASLLLRLGGDARAVSPASVVREATALASALAHRHKGTPRESIRSSSRGSARHGDGAPADAGYD